MDSVYLFVFHLQILDLQRIKGRSSGIGGSQQEGDEVSVVDQVRRILHSQLDTLLWIDQQTGMAVSLISKLDSSKVMVTVTLLQSHLDLHKLSKSTNRCQVLRTVTSIKAKIKTKNVKNY